jgi:hypothetical protein
MTNKKEPFAQANDDWDLETLYKDLASIKGKGLTPIEKTHLRGLLCGYSPAEIAERLHKSVKGVEADLCNSIYRYVKTFVGKYNEKIENWRNICEWLDEAGYKVECPNDFNNGDAISLNLVVNSLDINVRKAQINLKQNKVFVDINIRLVAPIEDDILEEDIVTDNLEENINENGYIFNNDQVEEYNN